MGYRYVMVDSHHVDPVGEMRWEELRYRPHIARYGGEEIIVVVRDRDLVQRAALRHGRGLVHPRVARAHEVLRLPAAVATATDGDNGGWFRNVNPQANFWTYFYRTMLDEIRAGNSPIRPTFINEYLDRFGAHGRVTVRRGAWNTDEHHGWNFHQWMGSETQRSAMGRVHELSGRYHRLADAAKARGGDGEIGRVLDQAHWHLLRAETSCNFYWGEAWIYKAHDDLNSVAWHLGEAEAMLERLPPPAREVDAPTGS